MAEKNMAEKKKPRIMKKQVRKTLGGLFLASAVAVAAIPTGSMDGGVANAGMDSEGMYYTHTVNAPYAEAGDSSQHNENYPIVPLTNDKGTVMAKSVYIKSSDDVPSGAAGTIMETTQIPICDVATTTIYSTSDGFFRFAYVDNTGFQTGTGTKFAVILAYTNEASLPNGTLTIPETVDAYLNLNDNNGSISGLTAVGKSGNYLFYLTEDVTEYYTQATTDVEVQMKDTEGNLLYWISEDGGQTYKDGPSDSTYTKAQVEARKAIEEAKDPSDPDRKEITSKAATELVPQVVRTYYAPCTNSTYDVWINQELYYYPTNNYMATGTPNDGAQLDEAGNVIPQAAKSQTYERIANAPVYYIGNQYLNTSRDKIEGNITTADKGIFARKGNIVNLIISKNLLGIGDYAFYGCSLRSVTFDNGVNTIGNHAFDNCTGLSELNLPLNCNLTTLGAYAFKDCRNLRSFIVPANVQSIGDGAFKNCWELTSVKLDTEGNRLTNLGVYVFQGCGKLESLTFPQGYGETIELSEFEGCNSLEFITTLNSNFSIEESKTCDFNWEAFRKEFNGENEQDILTREKFYIEAPNSSPLHKSCTDNEISYKQLGLDIYELTKHEKPHELDANGEEILSTGPTVTYKVDSSNTLLSCTFNGEAESLTFPKHIGKYTIQKIADEAFRDNCSLKEVTISENIESIGERAFQGCHNLHYVYFDTDRVAIGECAFQTQEVVQHKSNTCSKNITDADNKPVVPLCFVGNVTDETGATSSAFNYAMSYNGRYSTGSQVLSFIDYLTGWPTCLTVKYHYDMNTKEGYSELVDFPSETTLVNYASAEYLTTEEKNAAAKALQNQGSSMLTEDQETFLNTAKSLTIPNGVDAIRDGLFREKTASNSMAIPVYCYGLKMIETGYTGNTDRDGYPEVDPAKSDFAGCEKLAELYLYGDAGAIQEGAFAGDTALTTVYINGATRVIGNHAFSGCRNLSEVSVSGTVNNLGVRPFAGCKTLTSVDFQEGSPYSCENSIIYEYEDGMKTKIIELLEGRTGRVNGANDDFSGVVAMEQEAFQNTNASYIDLSTSAISVIPERAFADTESLVFLDLPSPSNVASVRIKEDAFKFSHVREINGAQNIITIDPGATDNIIVGGTDANPVLTSNTNTENNHNVTIYAPKDTNLYNYADAYKFNVQEVVPEYFYNVTFRDWDEELGQNVIVDTQSVKRFEAAVPPTPAGKEGYVFDRWDPDYTAITGDTIITAQYITPPEGYGKHLVTYIDYDDSVYATEYVSDGMDAKLNFKEPTRKGYTFIGWRGSLQNITADTTVYAEYNEGYLVRYYYYDDEGEKQLFYSIYVAEGESGPSLGAPVTKGGYTFTGWLPSPTDITEPTDTYAQYLADGTTGVYKVNYYSHDGELIDSYEVLEGGNAPNISGPAREGYTFNGWMPSLANVTADRDVVASYTAIPKPDTDPGANDPGTTDPGTTNPGTTNPGGTTPAPAPKYYVLTVRNGSGSGTYVAGSQPIIIADDPASGQEFSNWSIDPGDTKIASKVLTATVVTMPERDVTVTANYKAKTGATTSTGGGTASGGNSSKPGTSSGVVSSGTTVVIDKNGLSNTGVVSATVRGSSDNFTIKITESSTASEAIVKALQTEYGDISKIKYFPMDISLYDATGTKKITDTTGLSIKITLPLPDSLVNYAGNNKVAGVVNNKLDKLAPKFTTIDGVACITFTAEHFSPYVIYVETDNLTASIISDDTPKTGDGIHPKWFLSIGLASVSMVLFMKKDKRTLQKVKAS